MRILLAILFSCLSCCAQFVVQQPFFLTVQSGSASPYPAGKILWLIDSDLANGSVSSWVDRVSGSNYVESTAARQPTMGASGLSFDGGDQLTNSTDTGFAIWTNTPIFIVYNATSTSPPLWGTLIGSVHGSPNETGYELVSNQRQWSIYGIKGGSWSSVTIVGNLPRDQLVDIIADGRGKFWTNGVLAKNGGYDGNLTFTFDKVGANQDAVGDGFKGLIREIVIWHTNTVFTDADITALHNYRTNTYGGSP